MLHLFHRIALPVCAGIGLGLLGAPSSSVGEGAALDALETETVEGRIVKVDREAMAFTLLVERDPDEQHQPVRVPLTWTDDTECLLDGEPSAPKTAIRVPFEAMVTHEDKVAIRIDATTPAEPE